MCIRSIKRAAVLLMLMLAAPAPAGTNAVLEIQVDKPGVKIPPTFSGLMTEEINHSYDGGLFAELIQNRTFQDPPPRGEPAPDMPIHWSLIQQSGTGAKAEIDETDPVTPALPRSLRLHLAGGRAGVANDGYWGIPVRPNTKYTASFYAKAAAGFTGAVSASIVTDQGKRVADASTSDLTNSWKKYTLNLITPADAPATPAARFVLSASGKGSVSFSLVSLFPPTYENVPNGLRADLMQLMAAMHPAFIRLPGGNYLEGNDFANRFDWKKMIGPPEQRPGHMSCWGYRSSDGFGLPQYLLWCKQLGAEPVLALFDGYTLDHHHVNAGSPEMKQFVPEALEEIEYVSGPADSTLGSRRAADGLPEPLALHYVEIGNEEWFDRSGSYDGRFAEMFDAIRAKYPQLKIIATAPVRSRTPDLYDDHYYRSSAAMAGDWRHYDPGDKSPLHWAGGHFEGTFDRTGPKTFVGEWATTEGNPTPNLRAALADAVWMMGMERNADVVRMECYAPLLVNVNQSPKAWQWKTNLIGYDAMTAFGSPSYYAQAMFGQNQGDRVLPAKLTLTQPAAAPSEPAPRGAVGVGTWHTDAQFKDITVTAPNGKALMAFPPVDPGQWQFHGRQWRVQDGIVTTPSSDGENWAIFGQPNWTDYTLHLKARKTAGHEGFLILIHAQDPENLIWWNLGGWGNSRTQLERRDGGSMSPLGRAADFKIKPGRWYDLKVEVSDRQIRCFADGQLISQATVQPREPAATLFASATYASSTGEVIIKIVNMASQPATATLKLRGAANIKPSGKAIVLSGAPQDVNTVQQPKKVAPSEEPLTNAAATFQRTFPPDSLTLLRVSASAKQLVGRENGSGQVRFACFRVDGQTVDDESITASTHASNQRLRPFEFSHLW